MKLKHPDTPQLLWLHTRVIGRAATHDTHRQKNTDPLRVLDPLISTAEAQHGQKAAGITEQTRKPSEAGR